MEVSTATAKRRAKKGKQEWTHFNPHTHSTQIWSDFLPEVTDDLGDRCGRACTRHCCYIETGLKTVLGVIPSLTWREGMSKTQNVHGQVWEWTVHAFFCWYQILYLHVPSKVGWQNCLPTWGSPWVGTMFCERSKPSWKNMEPTWACEMPMWCFMSKSRLCLSAGANMSPLFHQSIAMIDGWYCTEVSDPFSDTNVLLTQCKNKKKQLQNLHLFPRPIPPQ